MRFHTLSSPLLLTAATLLGLWLVASSTAMAQTGVSEDRLSLPEGPGSLEGMGENVDVNANMGAMSYNLGVEVPQGYAEMTPSVGLSYNSGAGNSAVGVGWSMATPFIERMTNRGLPEYTDDDLFAANGGSQLVKVSNGEPAVYRARFEGGFVRYKWFDRGAGDGGYWVAELPDGKVEYYGADEDGQDVAAARVGGDEGVFRYHLVERVDVYGHRIRYRYRREGTATVPVEIGYVFDGDTPRFKVTFGYEDRPDTISDMKPGFPEVLESRLSSIEVFSSNVRLGRWALSYHTPEQSGGMSRLASVERFGLGDESYPVRFNFEYSRSLGALCQQDDCGRPQLVNMAQNLGFNFQTGNVTLVDINGDALPDILETPTGGVHRFLLNRMTSEGHTFDPAPVVSNIGNTSTHLLSAGNVQTLDVDGNGLADLLNTRTGNVLENNGSGDWSELSNLFDDPGTLPDLGLDLDPEDGDLLSVRFFDYDNDKRIDLLRSTGQGNLNQTQIYRNSPGGGFEAILDIDSLGVGFENDRLHMSDFNGDGLLDLILMDLQSLQVRLNRGRGRWADWFTIANLPFNSTELGQVEPEDLNNDGLTDLVLVQADRVRYALNINGEGFGDIQTLDSNTLGQDIPIRDNTTTVLFADMNGNGSSDIVWTSANGDVTYLEMFTVQPGLLSRIDNSVGFVQEITYGSSIEQAMLDAEAGQPWDTLLPHAMTVVTQTVSTEAFAQVPDITFYRYSDGHYDGQEKHFRGFERVAITAPGDELSEDSTQRLTFDLGVGAPHRAGLKLESQQEGDENRVLRIERTYFEDCPLEGIPEQDAEPFPIVFACAIRNETIAAEDNHPSLWATVAAEYTYDGFGNVTQEALLGLTSIGGSGCEPCDDRPANVQGRACGAQCLGDEQYTDTDYVHPDDAGGRWILRAPMTVRNYGIPDSPRYSERTFHYDGDDFVGLPAGQLTLGALTRVTQRINTDGDVIESMRYSRDGHGNVLEELNPVSDPARPETGRRSMTWDAMGLNPISAEQHLADEDGQPYSLLQRVEHDPLWNKITTMSGWVVMRDGQPMTAPRVESVLYDSFGRFVDRFYPEDGLEDPSERLTYEIGAPTSRVIFAVRSEVGSGALDKVSIRCFDGQGRKIQERTQLDETRWQVSDYKVYNANGTERRVYTTHTSNTGDCNAEPPEGTAFKEVTYDALGRQTRVTWNTSAGQSVERFVHSPTGMLHFDNEDSDPESEHFDTPTLFSYDGLGRRVGVTRMLNATEGIETRFTYDELNNFRGTIDPQGNEKIQTYDEAGRVIAVDDPDRGQWTVTLDDNGNILRETNARGEVIERTYDGLGRMTARWDAADPEGTRLERYYDYPRNCPAERCANTAHLLTEISYPDGEGRSQEWFGYDRRQRMTFHNMDVRGRNFEFLFELDNLGRIVRRTFPDNTSIDYQWDNMRLVAIPGIIDSFDYGDNGLISAINYANGTTEARRYDDRLRLIDQTTTGPTDNPLMARAYQYDQNGNLLSVQDDRPEEGIASAQSSYRYDALGRLVEAHLDAGRSQFDEMLTIEYDDIDNIMAKRSSLGDQSAAHVGTYQYNGAAPHAVTEAGGRTMAYDAAGAMTQRDSQRLSWDALGRLTEVQENNETLMRNVYGGGQERVLKETKDGTDWTLLPDFEIRNGVASIHIQDGPRRLAKIETLTLAPLVLSDLAPLSDEGDALLPDPDAEITAADAWVAHAATEGILPIELDPDEDIDSAGALLNAALERLLTEEGETTYYHSDLAGVAMSTNTDGEKIGQAVYYPYGQARDSAGNMGEYGYGNKSLDEETNTLDYGARHLDPWLGRWLSPDPAFRVLNDSDIQHIAEETGAYVAMINNPTSSRDVNGEFIEFLATAVDHVAGAIIGGVVGAIGGGINSYQEARVRGYTAAESVVSTLIGGLAGSVTGAAFGATSGLVGSALVVAGQASSELAGGIAKGAKAKTQNQLTTRRIASAAAIFGLSVAIGVATIATGGIALGIIGIVGATAALGAKLWAIKKAHKSKFSRAFFKKFGINKFTRMLGAPPEQIFSGSELATMKAKTIPRGEVDFSTNADGDVIVTKGTGKKRKPKKPSRIKRFFTKTKK